MTEETFHGVPRNKIPWYPTINRETCINCLKCVEYCTLGVYKSVEKDGEKKPFVKNPFNCVVLCNGCDEVCPVGAISHPSKKETGKLISKLRKNQAKPK
jgi:NAD-dependent dihydropyrimidine dehydrogenase PreA subunit